LIGSSTLATALGKITDGMVVLAVVVVNFSEEAFVQRINADLANDLGNLTSRSLAMAVKYCHGTVPQPDYSEQIDEDSGMMRHAATVLPDMERHFDSLAFHKALIAIWDFINATNRYIVTCEPWVLAKDPQSQDRLHTVIYTILEALRMIAVAVSPFMPDTAGEILKRLGIADSASQHFDSIRSWGGLPPGNTVKSGDALFPRVEYKGETEKSAVSDIKAPISIEDFGKIDLRVARVLKAEVLPKSDKLLTLTVDIGEERTIVAGVAKHYTPDELVGKKIIVLANVKPTKLMGVTSEGMLLAVEGDNGLSLLTCDGDATIGAHVR
jgi:methionyl-tRNA synthetase